jgi:hypothetical protein
MVALMERQVSTVERWVELRMAARLMEVSLVAMRMWAHRHPELSRHSSDGKVLVNLCDVKREYRPREPRAEDEPTRHYVEITSKDEKGFTYVDALEAEQKLRERWEARGEAHTSEFVPVVGTKRFTIKIY